MDRELIMQLREFNQAYKEMDKIYHSYAKEHGLSDAAFLVLYSLCERGNPYPQRGLCEDWSCPPQTINSALKALEKQGLIKLIYVPGNRKNKEICLTSAGHALAHDVIAPFIQAERNSFFGLTEQEREIMLFTVKKHIDLLKSEVARTKHGKEK